MSEPDAPRISPPPRAFTQGVGLVFQIVGGTMFLLSFTVCCGSSLLSKDWATTTELTRVGWGSMSGQRALSIALFATVLFGLGLAGTGLGMQAEYRRSGWWAVIVAGAGTPFWMLQTVFWISAVGWVSFALPAGGLAVLFMVLLGFAIAAARELRRDPPPARHDVVPPGVKIPYSHYHDDPPEVRMAAELEERRRKIEVQTKELQMLEEKLKRKLDGEE